MAPAFDPLDVLSGVGEESELLQLVHLHQISLNKAYKHHTLFVISYTRSHPKAKQVVAHQACKTSFSYPSV